MQATFYYNKSDKRYLNKSIDAKYSNIDIEMLEPSSVIRPSIKVSSGLVGQGVNYVYIQELERYYYIKDWIMDNGYIRMDLEVDVLMSFRDYIKKENVIVNRNEYVYNLYQVDDRMKMLNPHCYRVVDFPDQGFSYSTCQFILAVNGAASGS